MREILDIVRRFVSLDQITGHLPQHRRKQLEPLGALLCIWAQGRIPRQLPDPRVHKHGPDDPVSPLDRDRDHTNAGRSLKPRVLPLARMVPKPGDPLL